MQHFLLLDIHALCSDYVTLFCSVRIEMAESSLMLADSHADDDQSMSEDGDASSADKMAFYEVNVAKVANVSDVHAK